MSLLVFLFTYLVTDICLLAKDFVYVLMNMIVQITILYIVYLLMYLYTYVYLCIICVCALTYLLIYLFTYICLLLMYIFTYLRVYLFTYVHVLICNGKISISCWKVVIVWSIWCLFRSIIKIYVKFVGVFWTNCFMCLFASLWNCLLESDWMSITCIQSFRSDCPNELFLSENKQWRSIIVKEG